MKEYACYEDLNDIQTAAHEVDDLRRTFEEADDLRESLEAGEVTLRDFCKNYGPALELAYHALCDRAAQLKAEEAGNALSQWSRRRGD